MSEIKKELTTTLKIYREFFTKAEVEVKKQLNAIKSASYCKNCRQCCKIRYSEFSPKELKKLGYDEGLPVVVDPKIISPKTFIDEVVNVTFKHVRMLAEYTNHLNLRIKELFN